VGPSASSPPHEPSELLHVEGRAAAEGIDGGGLELGLGDDDSLVVADRGKTLGRRGEGGFKGSQGRPRGAGPRQGGAGGSDSSARSHVERVRPEEGDDDAVPPGSGCGRRDAPWVSYWATGGLPDAGLRG
jgi:hypothetical protein